MGGTQAHEPNLCLRVRATGPGLSECQTKLIPTLWFAFACACLQRFLYDGADWAKDPSLARWKEWLLSEIYIGVVFQSVVRNKHSQKHIHVDALQQLS